MKWWDEKKYILFLTVSFLRVYWFPLILTYYLPLQPVWTARLYQFLKIHAYQTQYLCDTSRVSTWISSNKYDFIMGSVLCRSCRKMWEWRMGNCISKIQRFLSWTAEKWPSLIMRICQACFWQSYLSNIYEKEDHVDRYKCHFRLLI